jgi:tetratricopeptide (TPR) repeat protein/adenosine/AMP kinase
LPERIGAYRVKRAIASGGMGTVYEAVQEQPRRTVAVKVMKQGISSRSALRRFEYESQILARLRHPGIAQVYEAGMHDDGTGGVPFFAMEYIAGAKTFVEYADSKDLGTRDRLELFISVCEAVHHGHQKGIIHRDLKPANILVDSAGHPKIIDFGVARATDSDLAVTTLQTEVGQLIGTIQYMSPEQIEADPHDIDTRSDVYALGVLLYQLLTGHMPYDLSGTPVFEATRIIHDQQPRRLSGVNRALRGDVETIVLHALAKDRERRYQSAIELSQDIRRYLGSRPIVARPPSLTYHFLSFARRNKAVVLGITAVFAALVLGIIGTSTGLAMARREASTATAVTGYFQKMFESVNPRDGSGPETRVADMLDDAAEDIDITLAGQPEVQGKLHWSIGKAYLELTLYDKAERQFRSALDLQQQVLSDPHPDLANTVNDLGSVLWALKRYDEAAPLYRRSLEMCRALTGDESKETADSYNDLAACLDGLGEHVEAESHYRHALALRVAIFGPDDKLVARSTNNLATCLRNQGRYDEAEPLFRDTVRIARRVEGYEHIDVAAGLSNLARCLSLMGRDVEAEPLYREALVIKRKVLRADHTSLAITMHYLAGLLADRGEFEEAESLCREAMGIREANYGPLHDRMVASVTLLARVLRELDRFDEAEALLDHPRQELDLSTGVDPDIERKILQALVELYEAWGRTTDAQRYRARLTTLEPAADQADD